MGNPLLNDVLDHLPCYRLVVSTDEDCIESTKLVFSICDSLCRNKSLLQERWRPMLQWFPAGTAQLQWVLYSRVITSSSTPLCPSAVLTEQVSPVECVHQWSRCYYQWYRFLDLWSNLGHNDDRFQSILTLRMVITLEEVPSIIFENEKNLLQRSLFSRAPSVLPKGSNSPQQGYKRRHSVCC